MGGLSPIRAGLKVNRAWNEGCNMFRRKDLMPIRSGCQKYVELTIGSLDRIFPLGYIGSL